MYDIININDIPQGEDYQVYYELEDDSTQSLYEGPDYSIAITEFLAAKGGHRDQPFLPFQAVALTYVRLGKVEERIILKQIRADYRIGQAVYE